MLHKFFEPGDWFKPKSHGYGAGLPIAWQGWVLLAFYTLAMIGCGLLTQSGGRNGIAVAIALMVLLTAGLMVITARRTRGGWRWRWGDRD